MFVHILMINFLYILLLLAPPAMSAASDNFAYVPENAIFDLTVNFSADPEPMITWKLNGSDLPAMTTPTLKYVIIALKYYA